MKLLKKLLLINWHYFSHQMIEFEQLNYMTGVNASGKSTIIDALQLVLFGDTAGRYFNKSASGKSARTLDSYLCGELSDNADGGYRYLRSGRFTSYVVTEWYDDVKRRSLTFGGVFDVYSTNDKTARFFKYIGQIPDDHFIASRVPLDIPKLREFFKRGSVREARFFDSGKAYRDEIYGLLGGLREKFRDLLKKAVAFNPDNDIQKFITEFICESDAGIDIAPMQDNIRNYRNLERTADELGRKKAALESIEQCFQDCEKSRQSVTLYSYLIDRANIQLSEEELLELRKKEKAKADELLNLQENLRMESDNLNILRQQYEDFRLQLHNDETERRLNEIGRKIAELEQIITHTQTEWEKAQGQLERVRMRFDRAANDLFDRANRFDTGEIEATAAVHLDSMLSMTEQLRQAFSATENLTPEQLTEVAQTELSSITESLEGFKQTAAVLLAKLQEDLEQTGETLRALKKEQESLEKGRFQFPQNALDLKQAVLSQIKAKHNESAEVVLVAEASEIKNDRWRNAIEGYLNTQKYYIIVPPQYVRLAVKVFDRIKHDKAVYDTGIVDTEKILKKHPRAEQNSLAHEIETDNPNVRAYMDYLLGRVIKCDHAEYIRDYPISITDEGLLYKNYVVRALNPKLWQHPAIGQNAIILRLNEIKREITANNRLIETYSSLKIGATACKDTEGYSQSDAERLTNAAQQVIGRAVHHQEIEVLEQERATLDTANVFLLRERVAEKEQEVKEAERDCAELQEKVGEVRGALGALRYDRIPVAVQEIRESRIALTASYESVWIDETGEPRYQIEIGKRGQAKQILEAFPREKSRAANAVSRFRESLIGQRTKFNHDYKMGYDVNAEDNREFSEALRVINENTLPDYLTRIEDTKKKAMEEFQEDFLSKLSDKIRSVKRDIKELNYAISSASFGEDTYSFKVEPNSNYERYYKMITDEMLMGGYTLMTNQFNEKYREEISELFAVMTGEGNSALDQSEYEKRVSLFTDYRTYLTFDIEVINKDGERQRLSRTIDKKSGGETQTPFYIAVLASFAQLYRMGRDKKANTARLIIFDEAFSKMDGERIEKSIQLLRKIGFQVILSTPTEKAGDIAPWVDRILLVLRSGKTSQVTVFDKDRVGELTDE